MPGQKEGKRCSLPVQPVDILPTFLELTGCDKPDILHGQSLVPILSGEQVNWERKFKFSGPSLANETPEENRTLWHSAENSEFKLHIPSHSSGEPELYAVSDTAEEHNIYSEHKKEAHKLMQEFISFCEKNGVEENKIELLRGIKEL